MRTARASLTAGGRSFAARPTYDLSNLATVKDWPWVVTVVDLAWGSVLATSVSYLGFLAGKWLQ